MGVGIGVLSEPARIFVGLDLGQSQDPTALSVVERAEVFPGAMDWVSYERPRARRVVGRSAREGRCTLVVDATGLGAPVVDMLRIANLRCEIVPVLLTGGE